jgi:DNA-binding transcriptional ArsR family regulator
MVVQKAASHKELDQLFRALADRTRRDIMSRALSGEEVSVSSLAERYRMSFAAVQKHIAVLERARLVSKFAVGRERIVRGEPERLARARAALAQLETLWFDRFSQLDEVLLADPRPKGK